MSLAQKRAMQILDLKANRERDEKISSDARDVIANSEEELFELLASNLAIQTKEFRGLLPAAQKGDLKALRLGPHNLTIRTAVQPMVSLELIHSPRLIQCELTEFREGALGAQRCSTRTVRFAVDQNLQPMFMSNQRYWGPSELADELFGEIADFFEWVTVSPRLIV